MSKIHGACSNTNLTTCSLYYEPWQIQNPYVIIIRGIFRALEYSKVRRYFNPSQIFCNICLGPLFLKAHFFWRSLYKVRHLMVNTRGVFRTQSNIYDGASFQKQLTAFSCELSFQKSSGVFRTHLNIYNGAFSGKFCFLQNSQENTCDRSLSSEVVARMCSVKRVFW